MSPTEMIMPPRISWRKLSELPPVLREVTPLDRGALDHSMGWVKLLWLKEELDRI
jgi:hypothetical protein